MRVVLSDKFKEVGSAHFNEDEYELVCDTDVAVDSTAFEFTDYGDMGVGETDHEYQYVVEIDSDKPVNLMQQILIAEGLESDEGVDSQYYCTHLRSFDWSSDDIGKKVGFGIGNIVTADADIFSTYIYQRRYHEDMISTNYTMSFPFGVDDGISMFALNMMNGDYLLNGCYGIATKILVGKSDDNTRCRVRVWRKEGDVLSHNEQEQ